MVGRALTAAAAIGVVLLLARLSAWQWDRAHDGGSLLNVVYAVEWLALAVAVVVGGLVHARRRGRPTSGREDASRTVGGGLIGPPLQPGEQLGPSTGERLRRRRR